MSAYYCIKVELTKSESFECEEGVTVFCKYYENYTTAKNAYDDWKAAKSYATGNEGPYPIRQGDMKFKVDINVISSTDFDFAPRTQSISFCFSKKMSFPAGLKYGNWFRCVILYRVLLATPRKFAASSKFNTSLAA